MTTTTLVGVWAVSALGLLLILILMSVWYRRRRLPALIGYDELAKPNRWVRWMRLVVLAVALYVTAYTMFNTPQYGGVLIAPGMGALLVVTGTLVIDLLIFGHQSKIRPKRPWRALPARLLVLTVVCLAGLGVSIHLAAQWSTFDGVTYWDIWEKNGVYHWVTVTPFVGPAYTTPLARLSIILGVVAVAAIIGVLLRPAFLPTQDFQAIERGLRTRAIRDILAAVLGATATSLAIMAGNVAWVLSGDGPDVWQRTVTMVIAVGVGCAMVAVACWSFATLILLNQPTEDWRLVIPR